MSARILAWVPAENRFIVKYHELQLSLFVHDPEECAGGVCVAHNPSDHSMRNLPLVYRSDTNLFERVCEHGIGHPDPDSLDYFLREGEDHMAVHGCDGCCTPVESGS